MNLTTISRTGKEEYSLAEIQEQINSSLEYLEYQQSNPRTPESYQCANEINLCVHELLNIISNLTKETVDLSSEIKTLKGDNK